MKKLYTIFTIAACSLFTLSHAQSAFTGKNLTSVEANKLPKSELAPLTTTTLVPTSHTYTCAASQYYYFFDAASPVDTGYAFGNNIFGEDMVAQCYRNVSGTVSQILVGYGKKAGSAGSTTAAVYSISGTTGAPNASLGTSAAVTTANISTTGYTAYNFSSAVTVSGGFFALVNLPSPTAGDTAVIAVNQLGCNSNDSLAWEHFATFGWWSAPHNYGNAANTDANIIVVADVAGGVNEYPSSNGLTLKGAYPSPATDLTTIHYSIIDNSDISVKVFDLSGRTLFQTNDRMNAGEHEVKLNVKNFSAGTYYYTIRTEKGNLTSKFTVVK